MVKNKKIVATEGLKWYDWVIFSLLAAVSFLCLLHSDILHTSSVTTIILDGHFLDFYDYNAAHGIAQNNYLISTYILFAIWNIPVWLLGWVTEPTFDVSVVVAMWYKLLPTIAYFISGYLMYLIAMQRNMGVTKSKLCAYAFLAAPLAFFSQFIFGQYDSFTVVFVLLGLYYWGKDDLNRFALFFGIAMTFKYFSLLIFTPLLFLKEKKFGRIIKAFLLMMLPVVLEIVPFLPSEAFREQVLGFFALSFFMQTQLPTTAGPISVIPVLWICICVYAYFKETTDRENEFQWAIYLISLVFYCFFGLSLWHPQWLIIMVPFLTFGLMMHKRPDVFCITDILMMGFFTVFSVNFFTGVDQTLLNNGILRDSVAGIVNDGVTMKRLFIIQNTSLLFTCFSAMLLVATVFKHPKYLSSNFAELPKYSTAWLRVRFLVGVAIFLIPVFICYFSLFFAH